jgi:hypothetical protein
LLGQQDKTKKSKKKKNKEENAVRKTDKVKEGGKKYSLQF